jgi:hypothetical protein
MSRLCQNFVVMPPFSRNGETEFFCSIGFPRSRRVARWLTFKPNSQFGKIFEGSAMEHVSLFQGHFGLFYGHLVYFLPFGIFYGYLVYFPRFGTLSVEKSGNPGAQLPL